MKIRDKLAETHAAIDRIHTIRTQVRDWLTRIDDETVTNAGRALLDKLAGVEETLAQPKASDPRQFPSGLNDKLAALPGMISNSDTRPPKQYYEVFDKLSGEVDQQRAALDGIVDAEVRAFNALISGMQTDAVIL